MTIKKRFFQTISLLTGVLLVALMTYVPLFDSPYLALGGFGLSVCIFVGTLSYLFYKKRMGLIVLLIPLFLISGWEARAGLVFSEVESESVAEKYKAQIRGSAPRIKAELESFDEKDLKTPPNTDVVRLAYLTMDMYDKLGLSDIGGFTGALDSVVTVLSFGFGKGVVNEWREYADDAESYLKKVASWQKAVIEEQMSTVPKILKLEEGQCWPCGIANVMLESIEALVGPLQEYLREVALLLLAFMTLYWIAIRTLKLIVQMGTASNAEYFTDLLVRLTMVFIAATLLYAPLSTFFQLTLSPMIDIGIRVSDLIGRNTPGSASSLSDQVDGGHFWACECCSDPTKNCNDAVDNLKETSRPAEMVLDLETRASLLCLTCRTYKQVSPFIASGQGLMVYSYKAKTVVGKILSWATGGRTDKIPYPFSVYLTGVLLVVVFSYVSFLIALNLMDVFLELGFLIILTPFMIATFPFPSTRRYMKAGFDSMIHIVLNTIALTIAISFLLIVVMNMFTGSNSSMQNQLLNAINASESSEYFKNLYNVFRGGENGSTAVLMLMLIICGSMANCLIEACKKIAEHLSGVSSPTSGIFKSAVDSSVDYAKNEYQDYKLRKDAKQKQAAADSQAAAAATNPALQAEAARAQEEAQKAQEALKEFRDNRNDQQAESIENYFE